MPESLRLKTSGGIMRIKTIRFFEVVSFLILTPLALVSCGSGTATVTKESSARPVPAAKLLSSDRDVEDQTIRFLEERVKRDAEDFIAHNKLAGQYLQRLRETGDV